MVLTTSAPELKKMLTAVMTLGSFGPVVSAHFVHLEVEGPLDLEGIEHWNIDGLCEYQDKFGEVVATYQLKLTKTTSGVCGHEEQLTVRETFRRQRLGVHILFAVRAKLRAHGVSRVVGTPTGLGSRAWTSAYEWEFPTTAIRALKNQKSAQLGWDALRSETRLCTQRALTKELVRKVGSRETKPEPRNMGPFLLLLSPREITRVLVARSTPKQDLAQVFWSEVQAWYGSMLL